MSQIRNCTEHDFRQILNLLGQLWPDVQLDVERLKQTFVKGLDSECQSYVCAEIDSKVVGFCSLTVRNSLWQQAGLGHIDEIVVDSHYRGRGIGSQLLDRVVALARQAGCRRIELDSALHRRAAHRFYEQKGFEKRAYLFSKQFDCAAQ